MYIYIYIYIYIYMNKYICISRMKGLGCTTRQSDLGVRGGLTKPLSTNPPGDGRPCFWGDGV